jgi:hypothetical protein
MSLPVASVMNQAAFRSGNIRSWFLHLRGIAFEKAWPLGNKTNKKPATMNARARNTVKRAGKFVPHFVILMFA